MSELSYGKIQKNPAKILPLIFYKFIDACIFFIDKKNIFIFMLINLYPHT